jgi:hypothetical protein
MPLHDWTVEAGWPTVHHVWLVELLRWIKPRLPVGYRAWIESSPMLRGAELDTRFDPSSAVAGPEPDYDSWL